MENKKQLSVYIIAGIIIALFTIGIFNTGNFSTKKTIKHSKNLKTLNLQNKEDIKTIKDATVVYGFVTVNTEGLKSYCKTSGYVPNKYVNMFNKRFSNTIDNMNEVFDSIDTNNKAQLEKAQKTILEACVSVLGENLKQIQQNSPEFTVENYCRAYDENANAMIEEKVKAFKQSRPDLFLD